jgi:hypothetical protein
MPYIKYSGPTATSPVFSPEHVETIPGGAMLHAADFAANAAGRKEVEAATVVGRTFAERDAGQGFGPAADADDEVFLTARAVVDAAEDASVELVRPGTVIYEGRVVGFAALSATLQAKVRATYTCIAE